MGIKSPNPKISKNEANIDDKINIEKKTFFLKSNIFNRLNIRLYINQDNKILLSEDLDDKSGIKNLEYIVIFDKDKKYKITSKKSFLENEDNDEKINMQSVVAIITHKNIPITIRSDEAIYNNIDYNTEFFNNVEIKYLNNLITSDKLYLDTKNNLIRITGSVNYRSLNEQLFSDNIVINIDTKVIDIFMNSEKNKVKVVTN